VVVGDGAGQREISEYLGELEPFGARLTYISIVCGALAVLLNAETVRALSQAPGSSASWLVPLGAALLSTAATIAAGVHKTQVESRLSQLQRCAMRDGWLRMPISVRGSRGRRFEVHRELSDTPRRRGLH
jgi:hypothetical protein